MSYLSMLLDLEAGKCAGVAPPKPSKGTSEGFEGASRGHIADAADEQAAFDETAGSLEFDHYKPRDLAEALASLASIPAASSPSPGRWRDIVRAATRFAETRWSEAAAAGWTIAEVFGVAPGFARSAAGDALITRLPRCRVGAITADHVEVIAPNGSKFAFPKPRNGGRP